jgi:hypothetical protein
MPRDWGDSDVIERVRFRQSTPTVQVGLPRITDAGGEQLQSPATHLSEGMTSPLLGRRCFDIY